MLDAWRERGDDRLDPVRFHFIEALERRAAAHDGEARRILDERLSGLIEAYAHALLSAASGAADGSGAGSVREPARGPLAALVDYIASRAPADGEGAAAGSAAPNPRADAKLEALDYFRQTWSKVNAERQLRQSLAQVPGNAGPLNSSSLVHRSLSLMRELSPGYLQQFLSYVDALSHLEQMSGAGAMTGKDAPRAAGARKRARGKAR
ncbi:hypothetical protein BGLT_06183 [Caballeronia glathei]|nr:DUF2894 domain-containing protein [Caballeronia glathei]CDY77271.1 hypothetical protein BGLT_06183 [Caballeronia glathei]